MQYEIHVKQVPMRVIASERSRTPLANLGSAMRSTLTKIATSVQPPNATQGAPFAIYHSQAFNPADMDVEMGVPIAGNATLDQTARVQRRELPGGAVASTFHVGPYETIAAAYAALYGWVRTHGHKPAGPPREIYVVGPAQGAAPDDYRTELELPID